MNIEEAQSLVFDAIRAVNGERGVDEQILLSPTTALFGHDSTVDSLSLVSLVVDVETALSEKLGRQISLTDEVAMSREVMPLATVGTLTEFIIELAQH